MKFKEFLQDNWPHFGMAVAGVILLFDSRVISLAPTSRIMSPSKTSGGPELEANIIGMFLLLLSVALFVWKRRR